MQRKYIWRILLMVVLAAIAVLFVVSGIPFSLEDSRGPGGMDLNVFLTPLIILTVVGAAVGCYNRQWYYLLIPLGFLILTDWEMLTSSEFWRAIGHAPFIAVVWWAVGFAFGLVISYWECRRKTETPG